MKRVSFLRRAVGLHVPLSRLWCVAATCIVACSSTLGAISYQDSEQNLVVNGDFELPFVPHDWVNFAGGSSFPGWLVGGNSIDVVANIGASEAWAAASGRQSVDLNGFGPGSITQEISTVFGARYTLSFALAGNVVGPSIVVTMQFSWAGTPVDRLVFDTTGKDGITMGWGYHQYNLTAASDLCRLTFECIGDQGRRGPALDDIRLVLVPIPEPRTVHVVVGFLTGTAVIRHMVRRSHPNRRTGTRPASRQATAG